MLRLVRIVLLAVAVLVLMISAGLLYFRLTVATPAASYPAAPGVRLSYALGSKAPNADARKVKSQVQSILADQAIDGEVWVGQEESGGGMEWLARVHVSPIVDRTSADQIAGRISNALLQEFPDRKLLEYDFVWVTVTSKWKWEREIITPTP